MRPREEKGHFLAAVLITLCRRPHGQPAHFRSHLGHRLELLLAAASCCACRPVTQEGLLCCAVACLPPFGTLFSPHTVDVLPSEARAGM